MCDVCFLAGYVHKGCFADIDRTMDGRQADEPLNLGQRFWNWAVLDEDTMTIEMCAKKSMEAKFKDFGLQFGSQCWLSNDYNKTTACGESQLCDMPCKGNPKQTCGGQGANSV